MVKKIEFTTEALVWQAISHVQGVAGARKCKFLFYRFIDGEKLSVA